MYKTIVVILRFFIKLLWGLKIEGADNIPTAGGAVIAANHTTWFDPVIVAVALKRPVHFMAKAELFKNPIAARFFSRVYAFPVRRAAADRNAIRTAQDRVKDGHLLGIFPEGTRNVGEGDFLPLQGGAALISIKTGVPVIPVIIFGANPLRWRQPVTVAIGRPINSGGPKRANKQEVSRASKMIYEEFSALIGRNN